MPTNLCKLCRNRPAGAQSHVESAWVYPPLGGFKHLACGLLDSPEGVERRQSGTWDRSILCEQCEGDHSAIETYACRFFRDEHEPFDLRTLDHLVYREYRSADVRKLHRFVLWTLWRVAASQRPEYRWVCLRRFDDLTKIVWSLCFQDAPYSRIDPEDFPIILVRYTGPAVHASPETPFPFEFSHAHITPGAPRSHLNRSIVELKLCGFMASVAVDAEKLSGFWASCAVGTRDRVLVLERSFQSSPYPEIIGPKAHQVWSTFARRDGRV